MKKNDFVTAIFEEIKESILTINNKLENGQSGNEKRKVIIPKELIEFLYQSIDQSIGENVSRIYDSNHRQFRDFNKNLEDLRLRTEELIEIQRKRRLVFRKLVVWQSISAFLLIIGLVLFLHNRKFKDNDLKFRYIQNQGGVNSQGLRKLDTIFHVYRDERVIDKIENLVEEKE